MQALSAWLNSAATRAKGAPVRSCAMTVLAKFARGVIRRVGDGDENFREMVFRAAEFGFQRGFFGVHVAGRGLQPGPEHLVQDGLPAEFDPQLVDQGSKGTPAAASFARRPPAGRLLPCSIWVIAPTISASCTTTLRRLISCSSSDWSISCEVTCGSSRGD